MSANAERFIIRLMKAGKAVDGHIALTVGYGVVDDYFTNAAKKYEEDLTAYANSVWNGLRRVWIRSWSFAPILFQLRFPLEA